MLLSKFFLFSKRLALNPLKREGRKYIIVTNVAEKMKKNIVQPLKYQKHAELYAALASFGPAFNIPPARISCNLRAGLRIPLPGTVPAPEFSAFGGTPAAIDLEGLAPAVHTPLPLGGAAGVSAETTHTRELVALGKPYTGDENNSGVNDNFLLKLTIFHDIFGRFDIPLEAKMKAFPSMLKGLAKDYYYTNFPAWRFNLSFGQVCHSMQLYFEGKQHKRGVLKRRNSISLKSVMTRPEYSGKSLDDCLHLLIINSAIYSIVLVLHWLDRYRHNFKAFQILFLFFCEFHLTG